MNDVLFAFLITLSAGLFTGFGGLVILHKKAMTPKFLGICLAIAAGVMIYVSFVEMFGKSYELLEEYVMGDYAIIGVTVAFFAGVALTAIIDKIIPSPDRIKIKAKEQDGYYTAEEKTGLKRAGLMTALSIALHNLPEGLIVFVAALYDPALGITMAVAIAIHNFPEGIAVASPIYAATGSKSKAIGAAFASGATEPLGALLAFFLFTRLGFSINGMVLGILFAGVAGMMIYISFNQLLPTAYRYVKHSAVILSLFIGMAIMGVSLFWL
ncbi:MAG: zinc transporter ZupT [Defluviitaleaceae bacterium]|nr:zinc transporter ZupT [Defluviitaleaceae bacterium]